MTVMADEKDNSNSSASRGANPDPNCLAGAVSS
jgi:hypothetical protein